MDGVQRAERQMNGIKEVGDLGCVVLRPTCSSGLGGAEKLECLEGDSGGSMNEVCSSSTLRIGGQGQGVLSQHQSDETSFHTSSAPQSQLSWAVSGPTNHPPISLQPALHPLVCWGGSGG